MKVLRSCENDPAGCVRHRLDDDWNAGDKPVAPAPASADAELGPPKDQIMADEESYVLNQVTSMCAVGNACSSNRPAVDRQFIERNVARGVAMLHAGGSWQRGASSHLRFPQQRECCL